MKYAIRSVFCWFLIIVIVTNHHQLWIPFAKHTIVGIRQQTRCQRTHDSSNWWGIATSCSQRSSLAYSSLLLRCVCVCGCGCDCVCVCVVDTQTLSSQFCFRFLWSDFVQRTTYIHPSIHPSTIGPSFISHIFLLSSILFLLVRFPPISWRAWSKTHLQILIQL